MTEAKSTILILTLINVLYYRSGIEYLWLKIKSPMIRFKKLNVTLTIQW